MSVAPGWYADPNNAAQLRWWDGAQWTPQAMAHPAAVGNPAMTPGYPAAPGYALAPGYAGRPTPKSFVARNINSALAVGVAILYAIIAVFAHFIFFGIFPIILTINAFRAKEPYAVVALVVSIATIVFGIFMYTR